jgi:hypothetical protein
VFVPPEFAVPSFLDILLTDPQAIVDALDAVFLSTEEASLGSYGIVTRFPVSKQKTDRLG